MDEWITVEAALEADLWTERNFRRHANKLHALAEKARQKILSRPDVQKWLDQQVAERIRDAENEPGGASTRDIEHARAIRKNDESDLRTLFEGLPDEAFKVFPWAWREFKRGYGKDWHFAGNYSHFADIVGQVGRMLYEMRLNNKPAPDINQMDFKQAEAWMMEQRAANLQNGWEKPEHVYEFADGWTVDKVTTEHDLNKEGEELGHCVGGYCTRVESGSTQIYSLRGPKGDPHVTIEIRPDATINDAGGNTFDVIQVHGKGNTDPKPEYKTKITEWFKSLRDGGMNLAWDGSGMMDGDYGDGEVNIRDLEDLDDWWPTYVANYSPDPKAGPYGLPLSGEREYNYNDTNVLENVLYTEVKGNSSNLMHSSLTADELGKAVFTIEWLEGNDPAKAAEWMRDKLDDWSMDNSSENWEYHDREAQEKLNNSHGDTHYINHDDQYMVPHSDPAYQQAEAAHLDAEGYDHGWDAGVVGSPEDYGFDPNTADNRYYNDYESQMMEYRDEAAAEHERYVYGDAWDLVTYIDWLAKLFPFKKGAQPPAPEALPSMRQMPTNQGESRPSWQPAPAHEGPWYEAPAINFDPEGKWTSVTASVPENELEHVQPGEWLETSLGPAEVLQKAHTPLGWVFRCRTQDQDDIDFMEHEIMGVLNREPVLAAMQSAGEEWLYGKMMERPDYQRVTEWLVEENRQDPAKQQQALRNWTLHRLKDEMPESAIKTIQDSINYGQLVDLINEGMAAQVPDSPTSLTEDTPEQSWQLIRNAGWHRVAAPGLLHKGDRVKSTRDDSSYGETGTIVDVREGMNPFDMSGKYLVRWDAGHEGWTGTVSLLPPTVPNTLDALTDSPDQVHDLVTHASWERVADYTQPEIGDYTIEGPMQTGYDVRWHRPGDSLDAPQGYFQPKTVRQPLHAPGDGPSTLAQALSDVQSHMQSHGRPGRVLVPHRYGWQEYDPRLEWSIQRSSTWERVAGSETYEWHKYEPGEWVVIPNSQWANEGEVGKIVNQLPDKEYRVVYPNGMSIVAPEDMIEPARDSQQDSWNLVRNANEDPPRSVIQARPIFQKFLAEGQPVFQAFVGTANALMEQGIDKGQAMSAARVALQEWEDLKTQVNGMEPQGDTADPQVSFNSLPGGWTQQLEQMPKRQGSWELVGGENGELPEGLTFQSEEQNVFGGDVLRTEAVLNGEVVGFIDVWTRQRKLKGQVREVYVKPEYRRTGIATALYQQAGNPPHSKDLTDDGQAWKNSLATKLAEADLDGSMVAFYLPANVAESLAVPGGEPADRLHVSVCVFEDKSDARQDWNKAYDLVEQVASRFQPIPATVGGLGKFDKNKDGETVWWAQVDAPGLEDLYKDMLSTLQGGGFPVIEYDSGFTPHVTLLYAPPDQEENIDPPKTPVVLSTLTLSVGSRNFEIPLGEPASQTQVAASPKWGIEES